MSETTKGTTVAISDELLAAYQRARDVGLPADDLTLRSFELGGMAVLGIIMDHADKPPALIDLLEAVNTSLGDLHKTVQEANRDPG
jgi:hypothetical protein